jgi:hypothetical protein
MPLLLPHMNIGLWAIKGRKSVACMSHKTVGVISITAINQHSASHTRKIMYTKTTEVRRIQSLQRQRKKIICASAF